MYAFPPSYPVIPSNRNYVCVVYLITLVVILTWWVLDARIHFEIT
jgi:hypothetical protein